ncbi:MAG: amylo-alpha-1,6-glucosidase [Isosphaeraceae bacterium]|nr:amylo-alpha-1,6-glucosidase [Isosphaeraceae bacterium]
MKNLDSREPDREPEGGPHDSGEIIRVQDQYYILATSTLADDRNRVLKHGETFAVFDHFGDIKQIGLGEEGLYHEGTRFLSALTLRLGRKRPLFLSSTIKQDNALLAVDLANPDVSIGDRVVIPRGVLHIFRAKFLWEGACYERIRVRNFGLAPIETMLSIHFEADFRDIFEVRGMHRERRGRILESVIAGGEVVLPYEGLDGEVRRTRLTFTPTPTHLTASEARFHIVLEPNGEAAFFVTIGCEIGPASPQRPSFELAGHAAAEALQQMRSRACTIYTGNEQFNDWLNRTVADLDMMVTETPQGPYPYAGVPWFSTAFGRDGIITALESLWVNPSMARGVLAYLAAYQADAFLPEQDAEPGKILHETRQGEMAALKEIPFGLYYGSVDSTPLFVILAASYYQRTGDLEFVSAIWLNIERALDWIDTHGDPDHDGFVEYFRRSPKGLVQQGWKDSQDSVMHADGRLAEGPIALCEVQGYVYAAKLGASALARALGYKTRAEELARQAKALRVRFEQAFWCEDLGTYALALDGEKRPCRVRSSNAGHCLWTGIASPERARRVAEALLAPESFSGFGIRTLAAGEVRYNPMSYHNGSVWPHDNALIAQGFARYQLKQEVLKVLTGLFDASLFVDLHRMPELFCGFVRRPGEGPTLYPVACAPQSWAAAAVFLLLQACLGLDIDAPRSRICFSHPLLPASLPSVHIANLRVGSASLDLLLRRFGENVGVDILRRDGHVEIITVK